MTFDLKFKERVHKLGGWFRRHRPAMRIPKFLKKKRNDEAHAHAPKSGLERSNSDRNRLEPTRMHTRQVSSGSIAEVVGHALQTVIAVATPAELPDTNPGFVEEPSPIGGEPYVTVDSASLGVDDDDRHGAVNGHVPKSAPGRRKALLIGISGESPEETQEPTELVNGNGLHDGARFDETKELVLEPNGAEERKGLIGLHRKGASLGSMTAISGTDRLKGPHNEVESTRRLLTELYGYKDSDIVILVDTEDQVEELLPTKANIVKHIHQLVQDAQPGDKFYFHYSGHSTQEKAKGRDEEEDGMNEVLCTWDRQRILDNDLKTWMVDSLPPKASLYAVFDTCNSGTILDLEHYRCNRVYLPWVNKGFRRTKSRHIYAHRQHALPIRSSTLSSMRNPTGTRGSIDQVVQATLPEGGPLTQVAIQKRQQSLDLVVNIHPLVLEKQRGEKLVETPRSSIDRDADSTRPASINSELRKYLSPIEMFCDGWCRAHFHQRDENFARVVCLSSCGDGQKTWEDANGSSMTNALITLLRDTPHPSFTKVLHRVNNSLHKDYLHLHSKARAYKIKIREKNDHRRRIGKEPFVPSVDPEMNNFQEVHLSSQEPLDLTEIWDP